MGGAWALAAGNVSSAAPKSTRLAIGDMLACMLSISSAQLLRALPADAWPPVHTMLSQASRGSCSALSHDKNKEIQWLSAHSHAGLHALNLTDQQLSWRMHGR